jgi:hypothetical protein
MGCMLGNKKCEVLERGGRSWAGREDGIEMVDLTKSRH